MQFDANDDQLAAEFQARRNLKSFKRPCTPEAIRGEADRILGSEVEKLLARAGFREDITEYGSRCGR